MVSVIRMLAQQADVFLQAEILFLHIEGVCGTDIRNARVRGRCL
jgi:hypothetical protein